MDNVELLVYNLVVMYFFFKFYYHYFNTSFYTTWNTAFFNSEYKGVGFFYRLDMFLKSQDDC